LFRGSFLVTPSEKGCAPSDRFIARAWVKTIVRNLLVISLLLSACLDLDALQRGQPAAQSPTDAGPPADLAALPATACRSGRGTPLSERAVACQAVLARSGDITSSCGAGWALCESLPVSAEVCAALPGGFYASSQRGGQLHVPPGPSLACTWSGPMADVNQRFLLGCGGTGVKTLYESPVTCGGFARALLCRNGSAEASTSWDCLIGSRPGDSDFADVVNTGEGGVLCCR
jgi:hypothetical protein